jgi:hypothetical protein
MLIWTTKQHGWTDKSEAKSEQTTNVNVRFIAAWGKSDGEIARLPAPDDDLLIEGEAVEE